jgi:CBS domain-containing protein
MRVRDVLKTKGGRIITIGPDATVPEAVARMVENNIGSLPVVEADDGSLVGVISERDLMRELHDRGDEFPRAMIRAVMTMNPITCDIDDEVEAVMGLMTERRIAKVPVIERGCLVGIVSVGDVVKLLYERTQAENHHLMDYLYGPAHA